MALRPSFKHKLYIALGVMVFLTLLMMFAFSGGNFALLKSLFVKELSEEQLRDQLMNFGWRGYITAAVLSTMQVICAFLPAEPAQVLSGFTFGFPIGLLCCMTGVLLGNTIIYLMHRVCGNRLRRFFIKKLNLHLDKIASSSVCTVIIFILYFLPAIPYGMICFFAATTGMKFRRYILVTGLGSLPSVCIGVGLGHVTVASDPLVALCLFGVLILLLIVMFLMRDKLFSKVNDYADKHKSISKTKVRKVNGFLMVVLYAGVRIYLWLHGVRLKATNKIGKMEQPSIVLCNHGSFIDFIYASALVRKQKPHFIVARLYFYHTYLGWLLRSVGAFPKSMFTADIENVKNCLTVLRNGEVLAMMPEARLSTVGRFEDIQENTYSFIKKSAVPVYTVKINGDYLADPKWGKGLRRGALVEAELDTLFTAEEVAQLSLNELKERVEARLTYDELAWLEERPTVHYRSKRMAEGLENILTTCPLCGKQHTITTQKDALYCEHCGYLTSINDRYAFTDDFRFRNFADWYDWQKAERKNEILRDENYTLSSAVELRLPSDGKGLTRHSGKGVCTLNRNGLTYIGTKDGKKVELTFSLNRIYRLLFGAGENFEIYDGTEIHYFVPTEKRSAVDWYMTSMILHDEAANPHS
ncbi:MAG: VTT domain-containing protein [Clostridia bacterium]|nr:VTT domain-containing protein [Clostridia bacterium]